MNASSGAQGAGGGSSGPENGLPNGAAGLDALQRGLGRLLQRYLRSLDEVTEREEMERVLRLLGLVAYHYGRLLLTRQQLGREQETLDPLKAALEALEQEMGWKR